MATSPELERGKEVVAYLTSAPSALTFTAACAVAGNAWQESLIMPVNPSFDGSDGMLQWRLDRLTALKQRVNWNTLQVQCQFFKDECQSQYPNLWRALYDPSKSLATLTADICDFYERPSAAGRVLDKRINYAFQVQSYAEVIHPEAGQAPTAPTAAPTPAPVAPAPKIVPPVTLTPVPAIPADAATLLRVLPAIMKAHPQLVEDILKLIEGGLK